MLELVRADVPDHAHVVVVIGPEDGEAAVRAARVDELLELLPERLDGVRLVDPDRLHVTVGLRAFVRVAMVRDACRGDG